MKITTYPAEVYVFVPRTKAPGQPSTLEPADIEQNYPRSFTAKVKSENAVSDIKKTMLIVGEWLNNMNKNDIDACTKAMREDRVYIRFGEPKTITVPLLPT
jgi:hypothetical protein